MSHSAAESCVLPRCFHQPLTIQKGQVLQGPLNCLLTDFECNKFLPILCTTILNIKQGRDVCVAAENNFVKSLIHQFPAFLSDKVAVIVSPNNSYMENQVDNVNLSYSACIYSPEDADMEKRILSIEFNLVHATPEHITSGPGLSLIRKLGNNLVFIAVEEAHCISQWGHNFLPALVQLSILRKTVSTIPLLAITATASGRVWEDIRTKLGLRSPEYLKIGFDRPNLKFIVKPRSAIANSLDVWRNLGAFIEEATSNGEFAIIYCYTCEESESIATIIGNHISCSQYHSKLLPKIRQQNYTDFLIGEAKVLVATMCFGMRTHKSNVRLIVHYGTPAHIDAYYQGVGQAGRDGLPAKCVLFYNTNDWKTIEALRKATRSTFISRTHLENLSLKMLEYLRLPTCRRQFLLKYLEDDSLKTFKPREDCCDNCTRVSKNFKYTEQYDGLDEDGKFDITSDAYTILSLLRDLKGELGISKVIAILRGKRSKDLSPKYQLHSLYGKGASKSETWYKFLVDNLKVDNYIYSITNRTFYGSYNGLQISQKAESWLNSSKQQRQSIKIDPYFELLPFLKRKKPKNTTDILFKHNNNEANKQTSLDVQLMKGLLRLRNELSNELDVQPFKVFSSDAIDQLTKRKPTTFEQLKACDLDGFYDLKYARYGAKILSCIKYNLSCYEAVKTKENFTSEDSVPIKLEADATSIVIKQENTSINNSSPQSQDVRLFAQKCEEAWKEDAVNAQHKLQNAGSDFYIYYKERSVIENMDTDSSNNEQSLQTKSEHVDTNQSDNELDLLLDELEKFNNASSSPYIYRKKRSIIEYVDTGSSDDDQSLQIKSEKVNITQSDNELDILMDELEKPKNAYSSSPIYRQKRSIKAYVDTDSSNNEQSLQIKSEEVNAPESANELDLLLHDLKKFNNANSSPYICRKKRSVTEYENTDSSDDGYSFQIKSEKVDITQSDNELDILMDELEKPKNAYPSFPIYCKERSITTYEDANGSNNKQSLQIKSKEVDATQSDNELDLLMDQLEKLKNANSSSSIYRKKRSITTYEDTDSSNDGQSLQIKSKKVDASNQARK